MRNAAAMARASFVVGSAMRTSGAALAVTAAARFTQQTR